MCHGYTLLWAGSVADELIAMRDWWRRVGSLVARPRPGHSPDGILAPPLLGYSAWTTSYNHSLDHEVLEEVIPPILWPAAIAAGATLIVLAVCLVRRTSLPARPRHTVRA